MQLKRKKGLFWRRMFDRVIVLDPHSEELFHFMGSSEAIWNLFDVSRSPDEAVGRLAQELGLEVAEIAGDVKAFIDDLRRRDLLEPVP